ncbi:MAG TPA: DUF3352 domain-containing protein [Solirubrobacteraceae bacterium]|nr:DUF3352 domain-containing protein [Solirubrobacteraceae bacterium]
MTDVLTDEPARPADPVGGPAVGPASGHARRRMVAGGLAVLVVAVIVVAVLALRGGSGSGPPNGAAAIVPADALAYVNVSLDGGRAGVGQALGVARRFPDFPVAASALLGRLSNVIAGGRAADYARQIRPWLGGEAALALLDTTTSTAGSLLILQTRDAARARAFVRSEGAVSAGSARGTRLLRYATGNELAFLGRFLVIGQDASVRAAIGVSSAGSGSLATDPTYRRASAGETGDRVLDAYASPAGVRRLLADQGGAIGALGSLLYQPSLQAAAMTVTPTSAGLGVRIHSVLDPTLVKVNGTPNASFTPTLASVMPAGATLMLDVSGLDRVAPRVLNAGSSAGVAGGIGPLLTRLGAALRSEGVNVPDIISIFHREAAVAVVPHSGSPTLVIVARTPDPARTQRELAALEAPLAQLFAPAGNSSASAPVFNDRTVGPVTVHQLALSAGLQLDYAVFRGLVVISTGMQGISAVAQPTGGTLSRAAPYRAVLGGHPSRVTALVYADLGKLVSAGAATGLTSTLSAITDDLTGVGAVGLTSVRGTTDSTSQLSIQVPR